jgi:hypothetical protein
MYIKIAKNKVKFNNILSGEELIIELIAIESVDPNTMKVSIKPYLYDGFVSTPQNAISGNIIGLPNEMEFTTDSHYFTVAAKLVYDKIINDLGLSLSDLQILADYKYRSDITARPIRLTIPYDVILKTETYRNLVGQMLDLNVPEYQGNDYYSLYLEEIYPSEREILELDTRVLIEEGDQNG